MNFGMHYCSPESFARGWRVQFVQHLSPIALRMDPQNTTTGWVALWFSRGSGPVLLRKLFEPVHEIPNNEVCATSKASGQPAHTRSLIRTFASR